MPLGPAFTRKTHCAVSHRVELDLRAKVVADLQSPRQLSVQSVHLRRGRPSPHSHCLAHFLLDVAKRVVRSEVEWRLQRKRNFKEALQIAGRSIRVRRETLPRPTKSQRTFRALKGKASAKNTPTWARTKSSASSSLRNPNRLPQATTPRVS